MKILQFGTGIFLRGFFGWITEQVKHKTDVNPEITVIKLTSSPDRNVQALLQTKVNIQGLQNGQNVNETAELSVLDRYINPYNNWKDYLDSAEDINYKLVVSNSTEAGLKYSPEEFSDECPDAFPAKLCRWLYRRFIFFNGSAESAVQVMPFELVEDNGSILKGLILKHAADWELDNTFTEWLDRCEFTSTLVDRIVTRKSEDEVMVEPFHFLALSSDKVFDVLPMNQAGINVVTSDLDGWRNRKVRILNGAHIMMVALGLPSGKKLVLETAQSSVGQFVKKVLDDEVLAHIGDPVKYADDVWERFLNPALKHQLQDIALNSIAKVGVRAVPSALDAIKSDAECDGLFTAIASFMLLYRGEVLEPGLLQTEFCQIKDDKDAMATFSELTGALNLENCEKTASLFWTIPKEMQKEFALRLHKAITNIQEDGLEKVIADYLG